MNDGRIFHAFRVTDTELMLLMPFGLLAEIVDDPNPDPRRGRSKGRAIPEVPERTTRFMDLRGGIQRSFAGAKKGNIASYKRYLADTIGGRVHTGTPMIELWAGPRQLLTATVPGLDYVSVSIPPDMIMVAVDGETQLAGRFDLMYSSPTQGTNTTVKVLIHHGISFEEAQQIFYYRNARGVDVSRSLAVSRDHTNDVTEVARKLMVILGPDLAVETDQRDKVGLNTIRQAVCWHAFHHRRLSEPVRRPPTSDLPGAVDHLTTRLTELRPHLLADARLRKVAMFVACTDSRVRVADVEARQRDDPQWSAAKANSSGIEVLVHHLRPQLPFQVEASTEHAVIQ
jgi:hypothetical protein